MTSTTSSLHLDPRIETVLRRLHARNRRELPALIGYFLFRSIPKWFRGRRLAELTHRDMLFLRTKMIALARDKCELCYLLCRTLNASCIVEVGTSFGVSTIYLAAAARHNAITSSASAVVISSEIDPAKTDIARRNLDEAGLAGLVDLRVGDALDTLRHIESPIDFVLLDSWTGLARPAIEMLAPHLRPGALIVCDNTVQFRDQYRDYLDYVRNPGNGFRTIQLPFRGGLDVSRRCEDAVSPDC
jgi:predicted O-methyltransferase YrrM